MRKAALGLFAVVVALAGCEGQSPTESRTASPTGPRSVLINGYNDGSQFTFDTAYVASLVVAFAEGNSAKFSNAAHGGFNLFNQSGDGLTVDSLAAVPEINFVLGGSSIGNLYRRDSNNKGLNVQGHVSILGSPENLYYGLDVANGGARFGSNEFSPNSILSSDQTALVIVHKSGSSALVKRVTVGSANSGGTGYRLLRVVN